MNFNVLVFAVLALLIPACTAQAQQTPATPPTTASAELMHCAQAQMVVDRLLVAANSRLETARQSNSAPDMRAAADALQATLRDVRAQLAPCASLEPAGGHANHTMRDAAAAAAPAASAMKPGAAVPPATAAKPAADPHAGHTATPARPTAPTKRPLTTKPAAAVKPPATDPHAGHTRPPPKPAPATRKAPLPAPKPSSTTKPPASGDPHAGHTSGKQAQATTADEQGVATDPVCGLKVDPKTAPDAQHQGRTYYFCSDQHRQLFSKNPAKYLPRQQ